MAQADNVPTTTRRSFVRSAAAASVTLPAAIATPALADASERELVALETEISQAWEHLGSVLNLYEAAEQQLWAWAKANPKPTMRAHRPYSQDEADAAIRRAQEKPFEDFIFAAIVNADCKAAHAEHEAAMADWHARHEQAKEELRYNRADKLAGLAHARINAAREAMAAIRATTIEGVRCKARASAKIEEWASTEPELALSIVEDLNNQAAGG